MKFKVHVALFTVSLLYAILFSFAGKIMPTYLGSSMLVFLRIAVASILFAISIKLMGVWQKVDWKKHGKTLVICAITGTSCNMLLFFKGLSLTSPINGAVLMLCTPIAVAIIEHLTYKKAPKMLQILGFVLATVGSFILITNKGLSKGNLLGDLLVAINAILYAFYLVKVKQVLVYYKPMQVNTITFSIGTLIALPFAIWELVGWHWVPIPNLIGIKIGYILFFTTYIVYILNAFGVKRANSQIVAVYIYLQPVLAAIIAIFLGIEELAWIKIATMFVVLCGVILIQIFKPKFTNLPQ